MSRIILSRWPDGEERVVVGYDRPLQTFFADEYPEDEDDETATVGPMIGLTIPTVADLVYWTERVGIRIAWTDELKAQLERHVDLDYPQSNVVVDRT